MLASLLFVFEMIVAYLLGSICSAVIVCRLFDLPDPRTEGSQNPGATNVLRIAGKQYAIMVLLADMLKGLLPLLLAKALDANVITLGFTCLAAVLGHIYPIYFRFKGGKGVATALGALLGLHFMLGIAVIATWLLVANITRYSSLASLVSITLAPFYSLYALASPNAFIPLIIIGFAIIYQHKDNITRLLDKKETKITFRSNKAGLGEALKSTVTESQKIRPASPKKPTIAKKTPITTKSTATKKPANKTKKT